MVRKLCRDGVRHGTFVEKGACGGPVYTHRDHYENTVTLGDNLRVGPAQFPHTGAVLQRCKKPTEHFLRLIGIVT